MGSFSGGWQSAAWQSLRATGSSAGQPRRRGRCLASGSRLPPAGWAVWAAMSQGRAGFLGRRSGMGGRRLVGPRQRISREGAKPRSSDVKRTFFPPESSGRARGAARRQRPSGVAAAVCQAGPAARTRSGAGGRLGLRTKKSWTEMGSFSGGWQSAAWQSLRATGSSAGQPQGRGCSRCSNLDALVARYLLYYLFKFFK
jgi:hypothetical protein